MAGTRNIGLLHSATYVRIGGNGKNKGAKLSSFIVRKVAMRRKTYRNFLTPASYAKRMGAPIITGPIANKACLSCHGN